MGDRKRTHSVEFDVDAEEFRRRSDAILAMVARSPDVEVAELEAPPETRSADEAAQAVETSTREAGRGVTDGHLLVREWLALQIGCAAKELAVIERRDAAFDIAFSRKGERYGETYLLAPQVPGGWQGSVALMAVWKPGRWSQQILGPTTTVEW